MTSYCAKVPPVADAYFTRLGAGEHPVIRQVFTGRWRPATFRKRISGAWARKLRAQGVTHVQLTAGGHDADFTLAELLRRRPWPGHEPGR